MNMQTFLKGGYGDSMRRETISKANLRQRPLRRKLVVT